MEKNNQKSTETCSTKCCNSYKSYKIFKIIIMCMFLLALGYFLGRSCGNGKRDCHKSHKFCDKKISCERSIDSYGTKGTKGTKKPCCDKNKKTTEKK